MGYQLDYRSIQPAPFPERPGLYGETELPPYRFLPGGDWPHPVRDPEGHMYGEHHDDDAIRLYSVRDWKKQVEYLEGVDLFNEAYWWEAHEAWEGIWRVTTNPMQREFIQGLIQLSVAMLKWHLRAGKGVMRLSQRARMRLRRVRDTGILEQWLHDGRWYMGLDLVGLVAWMDEIFTPFDDLYGYTVKNPPDPQPVLIFLRTAAKSPSPE